MVLQIYYIAVKTLFWNLYFKSVIWGVIHAKQAKGQHLNAHMKIFWRILVTV